jgi:predicted transcriptional regulator
MGDLSDFRRGQIIGARLAGVSVTKTATLLGLSGAAVSKVMAVYTNHGKTSSAKRNSGRKPKLSETDRLTLKRTVSKTKRTAAPKVTAELNIHLKTLLPQKQSDESFTDPTSTEQPAIVNSLITENKAKRRKRWRGDQNTWTYDDWQYVMWSDESSFILLPTSGRVYVWRMPKEACNPDCLLPTVEHGG